MSSDELRQFHYPQFAINQRVPHSETGIQCVLCYSFKFRALGQRNDFRAMVAWSHSSEDFIIAFGKVATLSKEGSCLLKHSFKIGIRSDSVYVNFL